MAAAPMRVAMLERRGACVLHGPAIRIVPLADDTRLREATEELVACPPDITVATTGIGFRGWVEAADGWGLGEDLLKALGHGRLIARGPKARGAIRACARITGIRPGVVFVPFHYGSWDLDEPPPEGTGRAANELTITAWDPVSKQPMFKVAAVSVVKVADGGGRPAPAPTVGGPAPVAADIPATVGGDAARASSSVRAP